MKRFLIAFVLFLALGANLQATITYFGGCNSAGVAEQDGLDSFNAGGQCACPKINQCEAHNFTCPGTGTQTIVALGAYLQGAGNARVAIYSAAGAFIAQGNDEIAVNSGTLAWYDHTSFTNQAGSPISPTLTGGDSYIIIVSGDAYDLKIGIYGSANDQLYGPGDYAVAGFPSTLVLENATGGQLAVRCGVEPAITVVTYYVDTVLGDDGNDGLTVDTPWLTVSKINGSTFNAGDSGLFHRGQTWRETLTIPSSGSAGSVITYGAYGTGAPPIISGANTTTGWTSFFPVTPTAQDGFEVGDTNLTNGDGAFWGGGSVSGTGTLVGNETTNKVFGSYAAKLAWTATSATALAYHTITAVDTPRVQFMMNVGAMTGSAAQTATINLMARTAAAKVQMFIVYVTSTTYKLNLYFLTDGSNATITGTTVLTAGDWHTIEVYYNISGTVGGGQYWIDGVSEGADLDNDTLYSNSQPNRIYLGLGAESMSAGTVYFDAYKYHTAYMGIGYTDVWKSSIAIEPKVVFWPANARGVKETQLYKVNATNEWFWVGGVLYVYSPTYPDTPAGIEVGARDYCIDGNSKNYIVIKDLFLVRANVSNVLLNGANQADLEYSVIMESAVNGVALASTGSHVYNCTIYTNPEGILATANGTLKNSVLWSNTDDVSGTITKTTNDIFEDSGSNPLFYAPPTDLSLQSGSPCRNAGTDISLTVDILGNAINGLPDQGAYEYAAGGKVPVFMRYYRLLNEQ